MVSYFGQDVYIDFLQENFDDILFLCFVTFLFFNLDWVPLDGSTSIDLVEECPNVFRQEDEIFFFLHRGFKVDVGFIRVAEEQLFLAQFLNLLIVIQRARVVFFMLFFTLFM